MMKTFKIYMNLILRNYIIVRGLLLDYHCWRWITIKNKWTMHKIFEESFIASTNVHLLYCPCALISLRIWVIFLILPSTKKLGCYINSISHLKLHIFVVACWEVQDERSFTNNKLCVYSSDVSSDVLRSI